MGWGIEFGGFFEADGPRFWGGGGGMAAGGKGEAGLG
jgi:hypothetical protein